MKIQQNPIAIILYGPQASGKGTQAKKLVENFNFALITTGDLLREARVQPTKLGQTVKKYYDAGDLVPDDIVVQLLKEKIKHTNLESGVIIDCFPRNKSQIKLFEELIKDFDFKQILGLYLKINKQTALNRIATRKVCSKCQTPYKPGDKSYTSGTCQKCQGQLETRADDNSAAIEKRLDTYFTETVPVLDYFAQNGNLMEIDGEPKVDTVYKSIINEFAKRGIIR